MKPVTSAFTPPTLRRVTHCLLSLAVITPITLLASGTRVGFKDAFAMGRGNAFVATADNPSALYYNPAGLTQLEGTQVATNLYSVAVSSDYSGAGGTASLDNRYQNVPAFYTTWRAAHSDLAYGFGVYAPFGLATEWPATSPLQTLSTKNELTHLTYNLSAAWQASPTLSLGASLTYNRVDADLRKDLVPGLPFRFEGDGDSLGFNLGLLWKASEQHHFGLSYSHHTHADLNGTSTNLLAPPTTTAATASFDFPEVIIAGWSWRPTPEWNIEVNLDWTNWDRFNTVTINNSTSGPTPFAFDWESGLFYELGFTRYFDHGWHASAGYTYTEDSTPDATYFPAVPDSDRSFYALGVGYTAGAFSADLAWHYADGDRRTVTGSPPSLVGATADGTYKNSLSAFALSLAWRF